MNITTILKKIDYNERVVNRIYDLFEMSLDDDDDEEMSMDSLSLLVTFMDTCSKRFEPTVTLAPSGRLQIDTDDYSIRFENNGNISAVFEIPSTSDKKERFFAEGRAVPIQDFIKFFKVIVTAYEFDY